MPNTHRRRDSTVEFSRVGGVNAPVDSRDPVYIIFCAVKQLLRLVSRWQNLGIVKAKPVERGKGEKVFLGPATFWGPRHRSKILKRVFQMASFWPQSCIKSILGRGSTRTSLDELFYTFPPYRRLGISISAHIGPADYGGCEGPAGRENGFPGPAVALDGPGQTAMFIVQFPNCRQNPSEVVVS